MKVRLTFHPQMWIRDYAVDVDPLGTTSWVVDVGDPHNLAEDDLVRSPEAPDWVQNWPGPWCLNISEIYEEEG